MLHFPRFFGPGAVLLGYLLLGSGRHVELPSKPDAKRDTAAFAATLPRKVYRYSVVRGGVYTPAELEAARRSDPVVAAHYADFGKDTRIVKLMEDMFAYVSYRKDDKVYWSKKKHKVCKGEVVITDGKNYARTRCANRISKVFKPPALAFDEPKPPAFDLLDAPETPMNAPDDPALTTLYSTFPERPAYTGAGEQTPAQTGASPGNRARPGYDAGLPTEVISPQFLPFAGIAPASFGPVANTASSGGAGGTNGGSGGGIIGGGAVVPEPAPVALLAFSAVALGYLKRRRSLRLARSHEP